MTRTRPSRSPALTSSSSARQRAGYQEPALLAHFAGSRHLARSLARTHDMCVIPWRESRIFARGSRTCALLLPAVRTETATCAYGLAHFSGFLATFWGYWRETRRCARALVPGSRHPARSLARTDDMCANAWQESGTCARGSRTCGLLSPSRWTGPDTCARGSRTCGLLSPAAWTEAATCARERNVKRMTANVIRTSGAAGRSIAFR